MGLGFLHFSIRLHTRSFSKSSDSHNVKWGLHPWSVSPVIVGGKETKHKQILRQKRNKNNRKQQLVLVQLLRRIRRRNVSNGRHRQLMLALSPLNYSSTIYFIFSCLPLLLAPLPLDGRTVCRTGTTKCNLNFIEMKNRSLP